MRKLRMALTVPAAIAGWYLGVIVALLIHQVSQRLCPASYAASGACWAPWPAFASDVALALGSLVCGAFTVLLPTLVAPSHRARVAQLAYAGGLTCSIYWLLHGHWVPVAWAAMAGAVTVWRIQIVLARIGQHVKQPAESGT